MMCATITYPLAVRLVKRVFRLRGFYAIHLAIAPFLALAHVNIFGISQTIFRIKHMEREFEAVKQNLANAIDKKDYECYNSVNKMIGNQKSKPSAQ